MSSRRGDRSRSESPQRKKHHSIRDEDEEHIKSKKEKKHKKKSSHKRQRSESDSDDALTKLPKGITRNILKSNLNLEIAISEDDYFTKSAEFRTWLREKKDKFFDELSSEQARRYFKKFVSAWNKYKLNKKYYDGMRSSQLTSSETTRYKWKHLKVNQHELDELDTIKHSVDRQTNVKFASEVQIRSDMDQEDKERYERALRKKDRKNFQATHNMVLEELVPKATGKEALIEKKRARNNYYRREASPDIELNESDLMGGDDYESRNTILICDYGFRRKAQQRAKDSREQRKREYNAEKAANMQEKVNAYHSKEQETMEMFRQMAEQQRKSGGGLWGQPNL
ncbi:14609_t:CDS:2 [Racocetra fulgida]|uniref:14609_t:CDS:1 n=1 Tax=Racocetra fulgida TaxID=60492 RepID=A0A9N9AT67_9GLOM|nr:14609_t:CDS:2 [Racocetra fulgida]